MGVSPVQGVTRRTISANYPKETAENTTQKNGKLSIPVAEDDTVAFNIVKTAGVNQNETELKMRAPFGTLSLNGREHVEHTVSAPKRNYVFIKPF